MSLSLHQKTIRMAALCGFAVAISLAPAFGHEQQPSTAEKADASGNASSSLPIDQASIDDERTTSIRPDSLNRGLHLYGAAAREETEPLSLPPSTGESADADEASCTGDVTGDGYVTSDDLYAVLRHWGDCEVSARDEEALCPSDLDDDRQTALSDLLLVLTGWGQCPDTL